MTTTTRRPSNRILGGDVKPVAVPPGRYAFLNVTARLTPAIKQELADHVVAMHDLGMKSLTLRSANLDFKVKVRRTSQYTSTVSPVYGLKYVATVGENRGKEGILEILVKDHVS